MPSIRLAARSARSVALCLPQPGARYTLSPGVPWQLTRAGETVARGVAAQVGLALHDLAPATRYDLEAEGFAPFAFETAPCAGLVDIRDHGAIPDMADTPEAAAETARAIAAAIAAVPEGGTVLVPPGRYVAAPVELRSRMTLHLAEGAVLAAPRDREGWPILPAWRDGKMLGSWEGDRKSVV